MSNPLPGISFDNTENAFIYKSDADLEKAHWLFRSMSVGWMVKLGTRLTPWAIKAGLPVKGIIRKTLFSQFVGGETLEQTAEVANMLGKYAVKTILDYGVEGGDEDEAGLDHAGEAFIKVIEYAGSQPHIPFMSVKVTGIARSALLEKLDAASGDQCGVEGKIHEEVLTVEEKAEWDKVVARLTRICSQAAERGVGVLIDAEESWIQDPVDAVVMQMMEKFNRGKVVVYNTIQLYRHDRLEFLHNSHKQAKLRGFILGAKIVRGAYMEKERKRAEDRGYASPIQKDKESCDRDYNAAIEYCIQHFEDIALIIASHNEYSNLLAAKMAKDKGYSLDHPHIHFSQLYGMSDNITFNLAKANASVSKYLPFGPLDEVVPYLMRRAQENSSVSGQTGRELGLIRHELRRRNAKNGG